MVVVVVGVLVLLTVGVVPVGAVVPFLAVPFAGVPVPEVAAGVPAGVEAGSEVNGVGSGGNGFDRIVATNSVIPASEAL